MNFYETPRLDGSVLIPTNSNSIATATSMISYYGKTSMTMALEKWKFPTKGNSNPASININKWGIFIPYISPYFAGHPPQARPGAKPEAEEHRAGFRWHNHLASGGTLFSIRNGSRCFLISNKRHSYSYHSSNSGKFMELPTWQKYVPSNSVITLYSQILLKRINGECIPPLPLQNPQTSSKWPSIESRSTGY